MKRVSLAGVIFLLGASMAVAQNSPFDMSTERGANEPAEPAPAASTFVAPKVDTPGGTPAEIPLPAVPAAPDAAAGGAAEVLPVAVVNATFDRFLLPTGDLTLSGEVDRKAWSFTLTPEQAASGSKLHLAYQNAVVVAPESSTIVVMLNEVVVLQEAIRSSDEAGDIVVEVPAGLLRTGVNSIRMSAQMRHRTDCTAQSTYELWAKIISAKTFLAFSNPDSGVYRRLDDVAALGPDAKGTTRIQIVAPAAENSATTALIVRLAEGLAMASNMPNQAIAVTSRLSDDASGSGRLRVLVGTPGELASVMRDVPASLSVSPSATFVDDAMAGRSTLVIGGPTWPSIQTVIDGIAMPFDRAPTTQRAVLDTHNWRLPNAPLFRGEGRATFAQLGIQTQEFSGRRFRTDFAIGVPADFYASNYGEATLMLDAAYSKDVLPGSHLDVYVNGNVAATVPITQGGGAILRQLPVQVTMRHFKPGSNILTFEAVLRTTADLACAPGAAAPPGSRFVLFDTSGFEMPNFARIGRQPDLSALAGAGFPYNRQSGPLALVIDHGLSDSLSAAATLLARMSVAAGKPIAVEAGTGSTTLAARDALFVAPVSSVSEELLTKMGLAPESAYAWSTSNPGVKSASAVGQPDTKETFERWREELSGSGWRGSVSAFQEWLNRTFDITLGSLNIFRRGDEAYGPKLEDSLMIGQQLAGGEEGGTWTLLTAPSSKELVEATQDLVSQANWERMSGHLAAYRSRTRDFVEMPISDFRFVTTQPDSIFNYRLIAANWLSGNALSFALILLALCTMLGLTTGLLLTSLGRHK